MAQEPEHTIMQCAQCGEVFKGNPQTQTIGRDSYCSIACEEGRTPRPMSDPASPDYHLFLKGNPVALVGKKIIASGLKRVDYSPEWCKNPEDWSPNDIVSVDEENEVYIRKDGVLLGEVVDYDGHYTIEGEDSRRRVKDILVVDHIKNDRWWVE